MSLPRIILTITSLTGSPLTVNGLFESQFRVTFPRDLNVLTFSGSSISVMNVPTMTGTGRIIAQQLQLENSAGSNCILSVENGLITEVTYGSCALAFANTEHTMVSIVI